MGDMKPIYEKIEGFGQWLGRILISRGKYYDERSESWQESVNGNKYSTDTEVLQELYESVQDAIVNTK